MQADRAVAHFDRTDSNRPAGTGALSDARAALDERPQVPASVRLFFGDHARTGEANLANRRPLIEQLADVVAHRDIVDADDGAAVAGERDVAQFDAAHQR